MRGRQGCAGGVASHLRAKEHATVALPNIRQSIIATLNGVQRANGHWKELTAPAKDVDAKKDIRVETQAHTGSINPILRFTISSLSMVQIGLTMY